MVPCYPSLQIRPGRGIQLLDGIYHEHVDADKPDNPGMREYHERIVGDRERLMHLIAIYTQSEKYHAKNMPELSKLKEAIGSRKKQYREESLSLDNSWSRSIASVKADTVPGQSGDIKTDMAKNGTARMLIGKIRSLPLAGNKHQL